MKKLAVERKMQRCAKVERGRANRERKGSINKKSGEEIKEGN